MREKYEQIFKEVMREFGIRDWYELFDSEKFDIVEKRCKELEDFDQKSYNEWTDEMGGDL